MKAICLLAVVFVLTGFGPAGCTTAGVQLRINKEEASKHMPALTEHEAKREKLKTALGYLSRAGFLSEAGDTLLEKIRAAMDLEYVYYYGAVVSLAAGNIADYNAYLKMAANELQEATALIRAQLAKERVPYPAGQGFSS